MDRKTSCIAIYTTSAPWYTSKLWKHTLYMITIVRIHCWVNISNTCSFIIIWNNVRGRKIEIEWKERSHTHGLTREIKRQYHRLSIKSFVEIIKLWTLRNTRLFWAKLRFSSPKIILFIVGGHGRSWINSCLCRLYRGQYSKKSAAVSTWLQVHKEESGMVFLNRS